MSSLPEEVRLADVMPVILEALERGESVRLYPKGVSMMPMLRQGIDSVRLSPVTGKLKKYDLPLYQRRSGQYVLHRIVKAEETYTCIGDNQFAYEKGICQDQLIAVVTGFYRAEKFRSVNSVGYKLYCRFWHRSRRLRGYWRALKVKLKR